MEIWSNLLKLRARDAVKQLCQAYSSAPLPQHENICACLSSKAQIAFGHQCGMETTGSEFWYRSMKGWMSVSSICCSHTNQTFHSVTSPQLLSYLPCRYHSCRLHSGVGAPPVRWPVVFPSNKALAAGLEYEKDSTSSNQGQDNLCAVCRMATYPGQ